MEPFKTKLMATDKQLAYIENLLEWLEDANLLSEAIAEVRPNLGENEDFMDWAKKQSVTRTSEVIGTLKIVLESREGGRGYR
jgi:hypothetical protein